MSSILLNSTKGYDTQDCKIQSKEGHELDEQYLQRYRCVHCKFIVRQPFQLICGDRICKNCLPSMYMSFNCPSCEELIEPSKPQQFFTDRSCQNDIKGLIVVCKCGEWQGSLDDWEKHRDTCPEKIFKPPDTTLMEVETSWMQPMKCSQYGSFCGLAGDVNARIDEPSEQIPLQQLPCNTIPVMEEDGHGSHGAAQLEVPPERGKCIELELRKAVAEIAESSQKVESLEKEVRQVIALVEDIRSEQTGSRSVADSGEEFLPGTAAKPLVSEDVQLKYQVKRVSEKCAQLNEIVTQLVADVEQHKGTLSQMNTSVDHLSQVVPRYKSTLEEMNLKIEILEVKSSTGVYVWKVNELGRRYREARIGKTTSLYSPPFYTSTHGYRLCLRAYLYGDGSGKGTHISLFIVLMKSEHDGILSWPFRHRVTLSLINQNNPLSAEAAITHKFVPNPESSSFQKPKDTFNIASGFPEFAELHVLNDSSFVKNDTIYFRVKLDPPETPTGPDSLNL